MKIRAATSADRSALSHLWDLGRRAFDGAPELMRDGTFDGLLDRLEEGNVLVAENDRGEICGMVSFGLKDDTYIGTSVAVYPAHRRTGLGRKLILAAHELARARGAKHALAVMWNGHPHLADFYRSVGYEPAARLLTKELG